MTSAGARSSWPSASSTRRRRASRSTSSSTTRAPPSRCSARSSRSAPTVAAMPTTTGLAGDLCRSRAPRTPTRPAQLAELETLLASDQVDCLGIESAIPDAFVDIINKYVDAGIPVFTQNTDVPNSKRFAFFALNERDSGHANGVTTANLVKAHGPHHRHHRHGLRQRPQALGAGPHGRLRGGLQDGLPGRQVRPGREERACRSARPTSPSRRSSTRSGPYLPGQPGRQPVLPHRPGRRGRGRRSSTSRATPARSGRPASTSACPSSMPSTRASS